MQCAGSLVEARGLSLAVVCGVLVPQPRDRTCIPCTGEQILNHWTTGSPLKSILPLSFSIWDPIRFTFATDYCVSLVSFNLEQSLAFFPLTVTLFNSSDKSHYRMSHSPGCPLLPLLSFLLYLLRVLAPTMEV